MGLLIWVICFLMSGIWDTGEIGMGVFFYGSVDIFDAVKCGMNMCLLGNIFAGCLTWFEII